MQASICGVGAYTTALDTRSTDFAGAHTTRATPVCYLTRASRCSECVNPGFLCGS